MQNIWILWWNWSECGTHTPHNTPNSQQSLAWDWWQTAPKHSIPMWKPIPLAYNTKSNQCGAVGGRMREAHTAVVANGKPYPRLHRFRIRYIWYDESLRFCPETTQKAAHVYDDGGGSITWETHRRRRVDEKGISILYKEANCENGRKGKWQWQPGGMMETFYTHLPSNAMPSTQPDSRLNAKQWTQNTMLVAVLNIVLGLSVVILFTFDDVQRFWKARFRHFRWIVLYGCGPRRTASYCYYAYPFATRFGITCAKYD